MKFLVAAVNKNQSGLVAQAVRRSPPTAEVSSSHLGPSMWVSWWTKRGPFRLISSALVIVRQTWSAGTLATHGPIM